MPRDYRRAVELADYSYEEIAIVPADVFPYPVYSEAELIAQQKQLQ